MVISFAHMVGGCVVVGPLFGECSSRRGNDAFLLVRVEQQQIFTLGPYFGSSRDTCNCGNESILNSAEPFRADALVFEFSAWGNFNVAGEVTVVEG